METNYRIAYDKYWQDLKKMEPEKVAAHLDVTYSKDTRQFIVTFFDREYLVDYDTERIYRKADGCIPDINAAIIILNYLVYAKSLQKNGNNWVSLKELPNGGMLFYPAFHKDSIIGLVRAFGHRPEKLIECAASLGGVPGEFGDASAVFKAFPEIPLCVIVWEGDEEVPANATILFQPSIEHRLHIESSIGLGMYLASQLMRRAKVF